MKVILNQAVPKVGKEGQVVTVANGYARNFLFPRGLAILAEKNQLHALERRNERTAAKVAANQAAAESLKEKLHGKTLRFEGKVGKDTSKLFGAVTAQDVADMLKKEHGVELDRKKIALVQPIKRLGHHAVSLDLHPNVDATINVEVYDPNAVVEVAPPVVEAAAEAPAETEEA